MSQRKEGPVRSSAPITIVAVLTLFLLTATLGLGASTATAVVPAQPGWYIHAMSMPSNVSPVGGGNIAIMAANDGGSATDGTPITITDVLPSGLLFVSVSSPEVPMQCSGEDQTVTCTTEATLAPNGTTDIQLVIQVVARAGASGRLPEDNRATIRGGGGSEVEATNPESVSELNPPFDVGFFEFTPTDAAGTLESQAGAHPNLLRVGFDLNSKYREPDGGLYGAEGFEDAAEDPKDVIVELPLGFVGDPQVAARCPVAIVAAANGTRCPSSGVIGLPALAGASGAGYISAAGVSTGVGPLFNAEPEAGFPAQFGFGYLNVPGFIYSRVVRRHEGYALRTIVPSIPRSVHLKSVFLSLFGDPNAQKETGLPALPFYTNGTSCSGSPQSVILHTDSWQHPAPEALNPDGSESFDSADFQDSRWVTKTVTLPPLTGCDKLQFKPTLSLAPDTHAPNSPAGIAVDLEIPQNRDPDGLATPDLRNATVSLPQGMAINPAAADGLQGCTPEQIDLASNAPGDCPDASQIATVEIHTPLLPDPLKGQVFLATPSCSPCSDEDAATGKLAHGYIEAQGSGVVIKVPGDFDLDPSTGQITGKFDESPQLPFDDLKLDFKAGPRAPVTTPPACGEYTTTTDLMPWSAPQSGPDATPVSRFAISEDCGPRGFTPSFDAGTSNNRAGGYSPLSLSFSRNDSDQGFQSLEVTLPPGLLAKLTDIPRCGDAEANAGSCSEASRIGTVTVGAGAGPHPYFVQGKVYLTGAYNGGPFGEVVVVPAVAGPFNLGTVIVRGSIRIDRTTAQTSIVSNPFPTILDGIPLQIRTVGVNIDRPGFTFNPTRCASTGIAGTLTSTQGTKADVTSHFQAANCASLPFKPEFSASTAGRASKAKGASLDVKIAAKGGPQSGSEEANIRSVKVDLPKQLPSRLTTLQKACLAATFEANPASCPAASNVGSATAVTPVLAQPLTGPAYLVSHGGQAFPDLEIVLQGEGVTLILEGNTRIKKGITSSTFKTVPDAPISSFELKLPTGSFSVLGTNLPQSARYSLCGQALAMPTAITGQNGAVVKQATKIGVRGCPKTKKTKNASKHKKQKNGALR